MLAKLNEKERLLFPVDTFRQGSDGIFDTLKNTLFLLVAIQFFAMPDSLSSLISIAPALGMLAGLFVIPELEKRLSPGTVLALFSLLMGFSLLVPVFLQDRLVYALSVSFCIFLTSLRVPFFAGFYDECYRIDRMAQLMSLGTLTLILVATGSSWLFGKILEANLENYRFIFLFSGILFILTALLMKRLPPSQHVMPIRKEPFWKNLKLIWQDRRFGITSISWMILGFANLWSVPIRTVFLSDTERGLGLDPMTVLLILGIIPGVARLVSNFFWARFYDRSRFVMVRLMMNILIGLGIFLFFITRNIWVIALGSSLISISLAGTPFIWTLWVTRIAPKGETRRYMSVHSFLCGLRGLIGPPLAFAFIQSHDIKRVGMISAGLALLSIIALLPLFMKRFHF
jgi:predicted MFS family arabinose efflux permease